MWPVGDMAEEVDRGQAVDVEGKGSSTVAGGQGWRGRCSIERTLAAGVGGVRAVRFVGRGWGSKGHKIRRCTHTRHTIVAGEPYMRSLHIRQLETWVWRCLVPRCSRSFFCHQLLDWGLLLLFALRQVRRKSRNHSLETFRKFCR